MLNEYMVEFLAVAMAHALAVASPGPDFSVVLRQSLRYGRRTAIATSIGIGSGILIHVAYTLLGVGILIRQTQWLFMTLKIAGTAYLVYLSILCLRARPVGRDTLDEDLSTTLPYWWAAFRVGFLTNVLNPKATLFFVALFAVVIETSTPMEIQLLYGIWMSLATMAWFTLVSVFFSQHKIRDRFLDNSHWVDRFMGVVLLGLSLHLLLSSI